MRRNGTSGDPLNCLPMGENIGKRIESVNCAEKFAAKCCKIVRDML